MERMELGRISWGELDLDSTGSRILRNSRKMTSCVATSFSRLSAYRLEPRPRLVLRACCTWEYSSKMLPITSKLDILCSVWHTDNHTIRAIVIQTAIEAARLQQASRKSAAKSACGQLVMESPMPPHPRPPVVPACRASLINGRHCRRASHIGGPGASKYEHRCSPCWLSSAPRKAVRPPHLAMRKKPVSLKPKARLHIFMG
jgi:hypothetical protein